MHRLSLLIVFALATPQLERGLLVLHGNTDVWKSRAEKATAREQYLLGEVTQLGDQFKC